MVNEKGESDKMQHLHFFQGSSQPLKIAHLSIAHKISPSHTRFWGWKLSQPWHDQRVAADASRIKIFPCGVMLSAQSRDRSLWASSLTTTSHCRTYDRWCCSIWLHFCLDMDLEASPRQWMTVSEQDKSNQVKTSRSNSLLDHLQLVLVMYRHFMWCQQGKVGQSEHSCQTAFCEGMKGWKSRFCLPSLCRQHCKLWDAVFISGLSSHQHPRW